MLGGWPPRRPTAVFRDTSRGEARANASTARYLDSYIEEFVEGNTSAQQAASLTNLDG